MGYEAPPKLMRRWRLVPLVVVITLLVAMPDAHAAIGRAIGDLLAGVFELPRSTLAGTLSGPPILGTVAGALGGAFRTVGYLVQGTFELVASAIPIAKAIGPFLIPIFL